MIIALKSKTVAEGLKKIKSIEFLSVIHALIAAWGALALG